MSETLSQELSARLDELGVVVESGSVWNTGHKPGILVHLKRDGMSDEWTEQCPAPTFTELWKVIANTAKMGKRANGDTYIYISGIISKQHPDPVEALGMMIVWLAENGHLKGE